MSENFEINYERPTFNPNQGTFSWEFIHEELDCLGSRVSAAVEAAFDMGFLILWTLESRKINPTNRTSARIKPTSDYRKYRYLLRKVA